MALIERGEYRGAYWAVWAVTESVDELLLLVTDQLRRQAVGEMTLEKRKKEFLATRLLLDYLMGGICRVEYQDSGRPFLVSHSGEISISHTDGYAAVIYHPSRAVGIDIEYLSERVLRIRNRFLSSGEIEHLSATCETEHLLLHWSAKESVYKALGLLDVDFRSQLIVSPFVCLDEGEFRVEECRSDKNGIYDVFYKQNDFFVLTCTVGPDSVL